MADEAENNNEEQTSQEGQSEQGRDDNARRTYTEDDVNRIVKERLARERAKRSDYDDVKRRAEQSDSLQEQLDRANAENERLRAQAEAAEHEKQLVGIRSTVAAKYGIDDPSVLQVGDDEESIDAYAQKLMSVFRPYDRLDRARSSQASGMAKPSPAEDFAKAMEKAGY